MFYSAIIVPLDVYVNDNPESAILLQGLGQAFLTCIITSIIFAPKLYIVLTSDEATQKAMMVSQSPVGGGGPIGNGVAIGGAPVLGAGITTTTNDNSMSVSQFDSISPNYGARTLSRMPSHGGGVKPLPVARAPPPRTPIAGGVGRITPTANTGNVYSPSAATTAQRDAIDEVGESTASSLADPSQFDGVELAHIVESDPVHLLGSSFRSSSSTPPPDAYENVDVPTPAPVATSPTTAASPPEDSALWRAKSRMSILLAPVGVGARTATRQKQSGGNTNHTDDDHPPPPPPPPPQRY